MNRKPPTNKSLVCLIVMLFSSFIFHGSALATLFNESHESYGGTSSSTGLKIASGGLTLIYFPVKAAYAGLGGIVGGIAYVFGGGDEEAAQAIWIPTIKGTYQITPDHLKGERPVRFFGQADFATMY